MSILLIDLLIQFRNSSLIILTQILQIGPFALLYKILANSASTSKPNFVL